VWGRNVKGTKQQGDEMTGDETARGQNGKGTKRPGTKQQGDETTIKPPVNPLSRNAPYLFFLTCLTPDDLTRRRGSSAA
jgi:hypothetical protein